MQVSLILAGVSTVVFASTFSHVARAGLTSIAAVRFGEEPAALTARKVNSMRCLAVVEPAGVYAKSPRWRSVSLTLPWPGLRTISTRRSRPRHGNRARRSRPGGRGEGGAVADRLRAAGLRLGLRRLGLGAAHDDRDREAVHAPVPGAQPGAEAVVADEAPGRRVREEPKARPAQLHPAVGRAGRDRPSAAQGALAPRAAAPDLTGQARAPRDPARRAIGPRATPPALRGRRGRVDDDRRGALVRSTVSALRGGLLGMGKRRRHERRNHKSDPAIPPGTRTQKLSRCPWNDIDYT